MTEIRIWGDTLRIDKSFPLGIDRIALNGKVVFEGKLVPQEPCTFTVDSREYVITINGIGDGFRAIHLLIRKGNQLVHEGRYDGAGQNIDYAKAKARNNSYIMIGSIAISTAIITANATTRAVPGGAIGGAISGAIRGAIIGAVIGVIATVVRSLLLRKRTD
jgi:hypothetical protein